MKTTITIILLFLTLFVKGQYNNHLGIMNTRCESSINIPPYFEVSVGQGLFFPNIFKNITKIDINYITKDEIVYGLSFGKIFNNKKDYSINALLGYNVADCAIIGWTIGITDITTAKINNHSNLVIYQGWHWNTGFSTKFIDGKVVFGVFGSSSGIGLTIGKIF